MGTYRDKVIVVTGASEGIGRALAGCLAIQGSKLVLAARNEERLATLVHDCTELGAEALAVPTDVTNETACKNLIESAVAKFGRIDVLVNNAGGTMWSTFEEVEDLSVFEHLMRLNYLSAVYCTHYALPELKKTKGQIIGVSSIAGMTGVPTRTGYAASKHAMFGFFDSLRIELQDSGVSVNMIAPDFVVTQIHRRALKGDGTPMGDTPLDESKVMTAKTCAEAIVHAMEHRQRLAILSLRGKAGRWLKLIAPGIIDGIARRAIARGH